jgi:PRTRC genetic system ParB family protein
VLDGDANATPEITHLPVSSIEPKPGFNPRLYRDPVKQQELTDSIIAIGYIIEPITVRPKPGTPTRYEIVVGHGRWLGAQDANLALIPAVIRHLSDREALAIAVAENVHRSDMSAAEEALAARRMLDQYQGDRAQVLRLLGWGARKFDARLLLLHATEKVLMALAQRRIDLGHAEHLSALEPEKQDKALTTIEKHKLSVGELHRHLHEFALDLATALFDRAECRTCPHNTTLQASLFEQHIGSGRCAKPACFQAKTDAHIEESRVALREQYNVVFLDSEKESTSYHILLAREVGAQQLQTGCQQCKHFGALLSTTPGRVGTVTEEVCFGPACREEKMRTYQASLQPMRPAPSASQAQGVASGTRPAEPAAKKSPAAAPAAPPKRVEELIHTLQRRAAARAVQADLKMSKVYAVLALLAELGQLHMPDIKTDPLTQHGIERPRGADGRTELIGSLYAAGVSVLEDIIAQLAGRIAGRPEVPGTSRTDYLRGAKQTLLVLKTDMAAHFTLDAAFLEVHTKAGIEAVLREAGFHEYLNRRRIDPLAFKKLMAERHPDIVSAVTKSDFNFTGFVPRALQVGSP